MANHKFRKTFGELNLDVVVLSEVVKFNAEGIAEDVSDEAAEVLSNIPGYEAIIEASEDGNEDDGDGEGEGNGDGDGNGSEGEEGGDNTDNASEVETAKTSTPVRPAPGKKATPKR